MNSKDLRLLFGLWKMALKDRYLGSALGSLWAILSPLALLTIYTFVFGFVLQARAPGATTTLDYAVWLIAGLGPWMATSDAISAATISIVSGSSMVKNLAFKIELLTVSQILSSLIPLTVTILFVFGVRLFQGETNFWSFVWLPLIIVTHYLFLTGIGLVTSAVNVFFRDFGYILPTLLTMILFATPIFYSVSAMPGILVRVSDFNIFYLLMDFYRRALLGQDMPPMIQVVGVMVVCILVFITGLTVFRKFKGFFESFL